MTAFDRPSARPARLPGGVLALLAIVLMLPVREDGRVVGLRAQGRDLVREP